MAVSDLLNAPHDDATWALWSFHHRDSHRRISQAIQAKTGIILTEYVLEPISGADITGFLQRNQEMHLNFCGILNIGTDNLQDVDLRNTEQFKAWLEIHWLSHDQAERALGI